MVDPQQPADSKTGATRFDRAEFAGDVSPGVFCRQCGTPIPDQYYDVDGDVICTTCYEKTVSPGRRWIPPFKALLLGMVAAVVGAGVYRMVLFGTGWNFSLVAILVGYVVGGAVRSGSGDRGGRFYQFAAVFLTYSALVGMFLPSLWESLNRRSIARDEAREKIEKKAREEAKADPKAKAEADSQAAAPDRKDRPEDAAKNPRPRNRFYILGMLLFALLMMVGLVYSIPIIVGLHSPISLFIFAVGLWQAWKMNAGGEAVVTGPYRVRA